MKAKFDINKTYVFTANRKPDPGMDTFTTIPAVDEILDYKRDENWNIVTDKDGEPVERVLREIRYIPGENSIYKERQSKSSENKKLRSLRILGSSMSVQGTELTKLEYLMKCNYNESNPERLKDKKIIFKLWDQEKMAKEQNEKKGNKINALYRAMHMTEDELRLFLMLNKSKSASDIRKITEMGEEAMRYAVVEMAEKDPDAVLKPMNTVSDEYKHVTIKAIHTGIIQWVETTNCLKWANGDVFCQGGQGMSAVDKFVAYAKTDIEYKTIMEDLMRMMNLKSKPRVVEDKKPADSSASEGEDDKRDWLDKWIEERIADGIFEKSGVWFKIGDKNLRKAELRDYLMRDSMATFNDINAHLDKLKAPAEGSPE